MEYETKSASISSDEYQPSHMKSKGDAIFLDEK